jgi:hypothetical protein
MQRMQAHLQRMRAGRERKQQRNSKQQRTTFNTSFVE